MCGAAGRMGRMLVEIAAETPGVALAGAIETPGHAAIGRDAGTVAGARPLDVTIVADLAAICRPEHVVVDFTVPAATLAHARAAAGVGAALVIGTTGFTPGEEQELRRVAATTRSVIAANYSIGLTVLLELIDEGRRGSSGTTSTPRSWRSTTTTRRTRRAARRWRSGARSPPPAARTSTP